MIEKGNVTFEGKQKAGQSREILCRCCPHVEMDLFVSGEGYANKDAKLKELGIKNEKDTLNVTDKTLVKDLKSKFKKTFGLEVHLFYYESMKEGSAAIAIEEEHDGKTLAQLDAHVQALGAAKINFKEIFVRRQRTGQAAAAAAPKAAAKPEPKAEAKPVEKEKPAAKPEPEKPKVEEKPAPKVVEETKPAEEPQLTKEQCQRRIEIFKERIKDKREKLKDAEKLFKEMMKQYEKISDVDMRADARSSIRNAEEIISEMKRSIEILNNKIEKLQKQLKTAR